MERKSIDIEGMTCATCAQTVENTAKKVQGDTDASVKLATESLQFTYDGEMFDEKELEEAVKNSGYQVVTVPNVKERYRIEGMTCANCAQTVEKTVQKLTGVEEASVNLATEQLTVSYKPNFLSLNEIETAVTNAGYTATLKDTTAIESENAQRSERKNQERKRIKKRLILSALFAVPVFVLSMGHMVGMPVPTGIDPMLNPLNFALAQLLLTLPVLFVSGVYFEKGFKTLFKGHPNMNSLIALGTSAAFIFSLYATWQISQGMIDRAFDLYYETSVVILTLHTLGKFLEERSKGQMSQAIEKLMELAPETARVIRNGEEREIPIDQVVSGDILRVRPGEKVPVDGII